MIWKKSQLAEDDRIINGFWAIDVQSPGRYRITMSRYPGDELRPIGASKARLRIGEVEKQIPIRPEATGKERGAYFVSVLRQRD